MEMTPVSRTVGTDQLVDEMVITFAHSIDMDWMLPVISPTGRRVEVPLVVIVRFRDGKLAHEHIYWDQASVLVQLGLLDQRSYQSQEPRAPERFSIPLCRQIRLSDVDGAECRYRAVSWTAD